MYAKVKEVIAQVSKDTGINVTDILGDSRVKWISIARQEAMRRLRVDLNLSYPEIAFFLHRRNPTTAMHGVKMAIKRKAEGIV